VAEFSILRLFIGLELTIKQIFTSFFCIVLPNFSRNRYFNLLEYLCKHHEYCFSNANYLTERKKNKNFNHSVETKLRTSNDLNNS
jgi:hypothetical protein